jgi:hypothetical protein
LTSCSTFSEEWAIFGVSKNASEWSESEHGTSDYGYIYMRHFEFSWSQTITYTRFQFVHDCLIRRK